MFWIGVNEGLFVFDGQNMGFCFDTSFLSVSVLTISSVSYYLLMSIWREKKKTFETNGLWILNFLKFSLDLLRTCFHLDMRCDLSIISTLFVMGTMFSLCLFYNEVLGSLMKQAWLSAHNLSEIKTTKISVHYKLMHLFFLYEYISRLFFPNS